MKLSPLLIGGAIVVIIAIGGGAYVLTSKDTNTDKTNTGEVQTGESAELGETKAACDVYTQDIAEQIPGAGAELAELPGAANASTNDVSVTNCIYSRDDPDSLAGVFTGNVLVRGAKTEAGKESNVFGFEGNQDRSNFEGSGTYGPTEPLEGIGDAAFWDPDFEQVNVLVNGGTYWLIVQADTRADTEQLAKLLEAKL